MPNTKYALHPIGFIRSPLRDREAAPKQGSEGLVLSGGRDLLVYSEMGEEGFDLWRSQGGGLAQFVEADVAVRTNGRRLSQCVWSTRAGGWPRGDGRLVFSPAWWHSS
jgi:hypothetical protein